MEEYASRRTLLRGIAGCTLAGAGVGSLASGVTADRSGDELAEQSEDEPSGWKFPGYDSRQTGSTDSVEGPTGTLTGRWSRDFGSRDPVVSDGEYVYLVDSGTLYALSLETGETEWSESMGDFGSSVPIVSDGTVYATVRDTVAAVDATDGTIDWIVTVDHDRFTMYLSLEGDRLLLAGGTEVFQLDAGSGDVNWTASLEVDGGITPPAVTDDYVFVTGYGDEGRVYCLDQTDGATSWEDSVESDLYVSLAPPVVGDDGRVFVSDFNERTIAYDATDGERLWETDTESWERYSGDFSYYDGRLYVGSNRQYVLDATDGTVIEQLPMVRGAGSPAPAIASGVGYYPSSWRGWLHVIDLDEGEEIDVFHTVESGMEARATVVDGVVLVNGGDRLYAIEETPDHEPPASDVTVSGDVEWVEHESEEAIRIGVTEGTTVTFDASGSQSPEESELTHEWVMPGGTLESGSEVTTTFEDLPDRSNVVKLMHYVLSDEQGATDGILITIEPVDSTPTASFGWSPATPTAGGTVEFDASSSEAPIGELTSYEWDFTGDDTTDDTGEAVTWTFESDGVYEVTLTVTTDEGDSATETQQVTVEPAERTVSEYADDDGHVQTGGLRDAIDHWREDTTDTDLLRDVIDAWRSGEQVT